MPAISTSGSGGGNAGVAPTGAVNVSRSILGWGAIFVTLVALADFEATANLSASFAWLIFISVLLLYGPQAFTNLSTLFGGSK